MGTPEFVTQASKLLSETSTPGSETTTSAETTPSTSPSSPSASEFEIVKAEVVKEKLTEPKCEPKPRRCPVCLDEVSFFFV